MIVAGDLFDTAAPTPEAERIVYRALLDLAAGGRPVVVVAGNHDSAPRLAAVAPAVRRPAASRWPRPSARPTTAACSRSRRATTWRCVALLPFPSQRYVVTADVLLAGDAADAHAAYADRVRQHPAGAHRRLPGRHREPGRRPPHGHGRHDGRRRARRPHGVRLLGPGHRLPAPRPSTWRSATCTGPSSSRARRRCTTAARRCSSTSARRPTSRRSNVVDVRAGQARGRPLGPADGRQPAAHVPGHARRRAGRRGRVCRHRAAEVAERCRRCRRTPSPRRPWPDHVRVVLDEPPRAGPGRRGPRAHPGGRRGGARPARGRPTAAGRPTPTACAARRATCSPSTSPSTTSPTTGWCPCSTSWSSR